MLHRLFNLASVFGRNQTATRAAARRWSKCSDEMRRDLIAFGGLLQMQPVEMIDGVPTRKPVDSEQLAYEAGRRDMAIFLLSLMSVTPNEFKNLMETEHDPY